MPALLVTNANALYSLCIRTCGYLDCLACPLAYLGNKVKDEVDDSDGCFGMDTVVTTSSGNQKLMRNLKIGEEVLSDETGGVTKFIGWMELNSNTKTKMIEVETDDGEKLIMSDTHIVFSYEEDKPTPTYVKDLSPGNVLVGGTGKVQISPTCVKIFRVISFISSREK